MRHLSFSLLSALFLSCPVLAQDSAPATLDQVLQAQDRDSHGDLRAVVVLRDGAIVAERDYNGEMADTLHDIRSAGKSITALLVGAAVARGQLATTQKVGDYWREVAGSPAGKVVLDDLLTMRSGLAAFDEDEQSPGNEDKLDAAPAPAAFVRAIPAATKPGSVYRYNSLGSYIAGRVVENASGARLDDFAAKTLFAPPGITRWSWGRDVAHHPKGQGNLSLRARDTAKIGQMVLDAGVVDGKTVIDAAWLQAALAPRVAIGAVDRYADGNGYFWHAKTQDIGGQQIVMRFA